MDDRSSTRIGGAVLLPIGRIGYSARIGDTGVDDRVFGDVRSTPTEWLRLAGGATLCIYRLIDGAPETDDRRTVVAYGRVRVMPKPGVGLLAELQSLDNPFFEEDYRVLLGLDLTMGRGPGAAGLSRNGWLR